MKLIKAHLAMRPWEIKRLISNRRLVIEEGGNPEYPKKKKKKKKLSKQRSEPTNSTHDRSMSFH